MNIENLIKIRRTKAPRFLLYALPGWGKSTFASSIPNHIFIDCEDGLTGDRLQNCTTTFPIPDDFTTVLEYLNLLINEKHSYQAVIIDTMSSLERIIWDQVCKDKKKTSIEDFGWGKGYNFALEEWRKLLNHLYQLREKNIFILMLAHSTIKSVSIPPHDAYDKIIPNLHIKASNIITEWCDGVFFGDFKFFTTNINDINNKKKAVGDGTRLLHTKEQPIFFCKSRYNFPSIVEIPEIDGWKYFNATRIKEK